MTVYTITITDAERRQVADALAMLVNKFTNAAVQLDAPPATQLPLPQPSPAARPASEPTEPRDRWARDRKGNELPNPEGCYTVAVHVFKAERADLKTGNKSPRMKVAFDSPTGQGQCDASCFDEKLFPYLAKASKEARATLHIVKKGNYLNVVGIRA